MPYISSGLLASDLVVQEVEAARSILVLCRSQSIEWQILADVQDILVTPSIDGLFSNKFSRHPVIRGYLHWWGPHTLRPTYPHHTTLFPDTLAMLLYHSEKLASSPRDKIYALVEISSMRSTFPIDYSSSARAAYTNLVSCLVTSSQSLDVICVLPKSGTNKYLLPSWVTDWSIEKAYMVD